MSRSFRGFRYHDGNDGIMVGVYLNEICNLECPYCMTGHIRHPSIGIKLADIFSIIDLILLYRGTVRFMILGGEPTLYPHLESVITHMARAGNCGGIELYTNGTHKVDIIDAKLLVVFSCHPIALARAHLTDDFIRNVNEYHGRKMVQAQMLQTRHNLDLLDGVLSRIDACEIVPNYIHHDDVTEPHRYNHVLDAVPMYTHDGLSVSYVNAMSQFKGWMCQQTGFVVCPDMNVTNGCRGVIGNLRDDPQLFAGIDVDDMVIKCARDMCPSSCLMRQPKYVIEN